MCIISQMFIYIHANIYIKMKVNPFGIILQYVLIITTNDDTEYV